MSLNWIRRGIRSSASSESSRLKDEKVEDLLSTKKLKKACRKSADEIRKMFQISLSQIEAGALQPFRGADSVSDIKPLISFDDLKDGASEIGAYLKEVKGFQNPTPIQRAAIPLGLSKVSFVAVAPTGSGKTFAFLVPILAIMKERKGSVHAWIFSPTRELATQTKQVTSDLTSATCKSEEVNIIGLEEVQSSTTVSQSSKLMLICTPGLMHTINSAKPPWRPADVIVLDEVDALLESSGLLSACDFLTKQGDGPRPLLMMFTASLQRSGKNIELISQMLPHNSPVLQIGQSTMSASDHIDFRLIDCASESGKLLALKQLIESHELVPPCLIFVQDKDRAEMLVTHLTTNVFKEENFKAAVVTGLHGNMTSEERLKSYEAFLKGESWILVCTDIGSRGLDFSSSVRLVINYDIPTNRESLIHRMGRTGRADLKGRAITLYTKSDLDFMRVVTSVMRETKIPIPKELQHLPQVDIKDLVQHPPIRAPIGHLEKDGAKVLKKHALLIRKEAQNPKKTANKTRFKIKNFKRKRRSGDKKKSSAHSSSSTRRVPE